MSTKRQRDEPKPAKAAAAKKVTKTHEESVPVAAVEKNGKKNGKVVAKAAPHVHGKNCKHDHEDDHDSTPSLVHGLDSEVGEAIADVNDEIEAHIDEEEVEVRKIQSKFEMERKPLYEKRDKLFEKIPNFWVQAVSNYSRLRNQFSDVDSEILESLTNLKVVTSVNDKSETVLTYSLTFKDNKYFKAGTGTKTLIDAVDAEMEDSEPHIRITTSAMKFKQPKFVEDNEDSFFVTWLTEDKTPSNVDEYHAMIAELGSLVQACYNNAFNLFLGIVEDEEEDFDDDDEDIPSDFEEDEEDDDDEEQ